MQKITPFLWFNDNAEEAAHFYTSIFKNSKITSIRNYPDGMPGSQDTVTTVEFELDGQPFIGLNGGPQFTFSPAISMFVSCQSQQEVDELWEKLAAGGEVQRCGWLTDKYGISWQIVPDRLDELLLSEDAAKSRRTMAALLTMTKLDLPALEHAYEHG